MLRISNVRCGAIVRIQPCATCDLLAKRDRCRLALKDWRPRPQIDWHRQISAEAAQSLRERGDVFACLIPSCLACEPNLTRSEYSQPFRHIQYIRTASLHRAMATLAIFLCRTIATCTHRRLQSDPNALRLALLLQQETQQRADLLRDVSQSLIAGTGVLARDQS